MAGAIGERGAANAVAGLKLGVDQDGDVARSDLGEKLVQEIMRMKLVEPEAVIGPYEDAVAVAVRRLDDEAGKRTKPLGEAGEVLDCEAIGPGEALPKHHGALPY